MNRLFKNKSTNLTIIMKNDKIDNVLRDTEKSLKGKLSDFFYNFTAHKLIQIYTSVSHLDISCHHLYKIKML